MEKEGKMIVVEGYKDFRRMKNEGIIERIQLSNLRYNLYVLWQLFGVNAYSLN